MKRSSSLISLALGAALVFTASTPASFAAANRIGGPCKTLNQKIKIGSKAAICSKVGSKFFWKKSLATAKTASEAPSPSGASQSPSVPAKTSPSPGLTAQSAYAISVSAGSWFFNFAYSIDSVKGTLKGDATKSKILYLPAGKLVQLTLTNSADVPHGFWIPGLLVDKELLPGNKANVEFTPDKVGTYPSSCNISCGRGHATMSFTVEVVSEADYLKYLASLKA